MTAAAAIAKMSGEEQVEAYASLLAELDRHYEKDPAAWLLEQVWTRDEASQQIRRWPDKGYLKELVAIIEEEQLIGLPKSRRMMVTWIVAAWCVHRVRYQANNAIFIQSETEEKAAYVVDQRCVFIEEHLDEPRLRRPYHAVRTNEGAIGKVTYGTESYLRAIAEGGEKMRTFTPSVLVMDESEFQRRGHQALVAALSMAEKKAKIILLSSSNGSLGVLAGICREAGFRRFAG